MIYLFLTTRNKQRTTFRSDETVTKGRAFIIIKALGTVQKEYGTGTNKCSSHGLSACDILYVFFFQNEFFNVCFFNHGGMIFCTFSALRLCSFE